MELGRDWDLFAPLLLGELATLGATDEEVDVILDRAWHGVSEIENIHDFATGALELLRGGNFPYNSTVDGGRQSGIPGNGTRERETDQG